jgi:putative ATPase
VDDLFAKQDAKGFETARDVPLAARMRPRSLEEYIGQSHLLGEGRLLRRAILADRFTSLILFGPPGTGKTSLARIIATATKCHFEPLSGVESNVAEIRRELVKAANRLAHSGQRTVLFIDEIHRFSKAQQDVLLPEVESGAIRLIGATTHNPFFYITSALVSRSMIFELKPLETSELIEIQRRALADVERGLGSEAIEASEEALRHFAEMSDGDTRKCLGALELAALTTPPGEDGVKRIGLAEAVESIQKKAVVYDRDGDAHYDTISAFIKSIRGSDPDAALYWLAKMLHAGEDPLFIARRLVIAASEDIGLADSNALLVANAAKQAVEFIGMPEGRIPLAHATVYLATAPKSNRAYVALTKAMADIEIGHTLAVPESLRDKSYAGAKRLGRGEGYLYSHDFEGSYVPQAYLPEGRKYYEPTQNGMEKRIAERLDFWRARFEEAQAQKRKDRQSAAGNSGAPQG